MGARFIFPESRVDVLLPLSVLGTYIDRREVHMLSVVGRLRDGVSLDAARREAAPIAAQLRQEHAKEDGGLGITVRPLRDDLVGSVRRPILVLFGAVCAVLLIGCANVTNLMFGRAWSRRQELAVRTAMGAQPGAIVQQLLVESAVIALASAAAREWASPSSRLARCPTCCRRRSALLGHVGVDAPVLAFTLIVSVVVTLVCGTAPAFDAARTHDAPDAGRFGSPVARARCSPDVPRPRRRRARARARVDRGRRSSHQQLRATLRRRSGFPPRSRWSG